jgi:hypothetical protein
MIKELFIAQEIRKKNITSEPIALRGIQKNPK